MIRTGRSVWPSSRNPPLVLRLLALIAASISCSETLYSCSLAGIDQHLILLDVAAHDDHFGDAGQLQQPRPEHPVGSGPQIHPVFERRAERLPCAVGRCR